MLMGGKVHIYGDHIDTDIIIAARYLVTFDEKELARHCMEDLDTEFAQRVQAGDVMVAGRNFGCGSSREHAPIALKGAGISCVIAKSFARIFYRNALNIGLPMLECPEAVDRIQPGDEIQVDLARGVIYNRTRGETYSTVPYPEFMQKLIAAGGLVPYTRAKLQEAGHA